MRLCCPCCRRLLPPKDRGERAQEGGSIAPVRRSKASDYPSPMKGSPRRSSGKVRDVVPARRSQTDRHRSGQGGRGPKELCDTCDLRTESTHVRENQEMPPHRRNWLPRRFLSV